MIQDEQSQPSASANLVALPVPFRQQTLPSMAEELSGYLNDLFPQSMVGERPCAAEQPGILCIAKELYTWSRVPYEQFQVAEGSEADEYGISPNDMAMVAKDLAEEIERAISFSCSLWNLRVTSRYEMLNTQTAVVGKKTRLDMQWESVSKYSTPSYTGVDDWVARNLLISYFNAAPVLCTRSHILRDWMAAFGTQPQYTSFEQRVWSPLMEYNDAVGASMDERKPIANDTHRLSGAVGLLRILTASLAGGGLAKGTASRMTSPYLPDGSGMGIRGNRGRPRFVVNTDSFLKGHNQCIMVYTQDCNVPPKKDEWAGAVLKAMRTAHCGTPLPAFRSVKDDLAGWQAEAPVYRDGAWCAMMVRKTLD